MALTDIQCRNAKAQPKAYRLPDGGGLFLWVTPSGGKIWRMRYRFPKGGKETTIAIGEYKSFSLAEAREKRAEIKRMIAENINPMTSKREELENVKEELANTFKDVAMLWYEHNKDNWVERTQGYVLRRLEQKIFPHIGNIPIKQIKRKDILNTLRKIEDEGKNNLTHKIYSYCNGICKYACHEEIIEVNPASELSSSLKKYKTTHHAALEAHEIPAFINTLERNNARLYETTRNAIKLLMLTFVRTSELINARWDEIDFENAQWTIPDDRMKMDKSYIIPLSRQSIELFKYFYELHGNREFVFPNRNDPRRTMSNSTILRGLYQLGYKGKLTGHGFRGTAMSVIMEKLGYRYEVADLQLAHAPKDKMQAAYARAIFLDERTKMMQDWADWLDKAGLKGC